MQKMKCISEDQYNRMLESYDRAMEGLRDLKEQFHAVHSDPDRVAPVQPESCLGDIMGILMMVDDNTLKGVHIFVQEYAGRSGHDGKKIEKGIAQECRKSIMSALKDVDDIKILRRIYISILVAKGNHCDIATGRETGHEELVCGTGAEATKKDESAGHAYIPEKYIHAIQNRTDKRIQGVQRGSGGICPGSDL